jgi:hypothetical protein
MRNVLRMDGRGHAEDRIGEETQENSRAISRREADATQRDRSYETNVECMTVYSDLVLSKLVLTDGTCTYARVTDPEVVDIVCKAVGHQ